jgi:hypothetical protein
MISVQANIKACKENMNQLIAQRNEINNEILRLEGALRVFVDLEKTGVSDIPYNKNPLETTEVIDAVDVQAGGSEQEQQNGVSL